MLIFIVPILSAHHLLLGEDAISGGVVEPVGDSLMCPGETICAPVRLKMLVEDWGLIRDRQETLTLDWEESTPHGVERGDSVD